MIDRSTEPMSEWSLGENPNANSVDLGGCEDKRERNWEVQGKMPRNSDYVNVPTPPGILSTFQLLNISASQHLSFSTSRHLNFSIVLRGYSIEFVLRCAYTQWCYQVIRHLHQSHLDFHKTKAWQRSVNILSITCSWQLVSSHVGRA